MAIVKEPKGVNLIVDPRPLTEKERREISDIIANYKAKRTKNLKSKVTIVPPVRRAN